MLITVREKQVGKKKDKVVYEYTYVDAATIFSRVISTKLLYDGRAEIIAAPQRCIKCKNTTQHVYYAFDNKVKCLMCASVLDNSKDDRPLAKVLEYKREDK